MVMQLGWTYVVARAITSAIKFTYAPALNCRLLTVFASSLIYFGIVVASRKWGRIMKHSNTLTILWATGVPSFLVLGIITMIWSVSFEQSEMNIGAYALQVLIIVCALRTLILLCRYVYRSFKALRAPGFVDKERMNDLWSGAIRISPPNTLNWRNMSAKARFIFVATHFCNSALWTWLVIYYRYFCHSFIGQSSWTMAFLWLFLASEWFCFSGLFLTVWPRRAGGLDLTNPK